FGSVVAEFDGVDAERPAGSKDPEQFDSFAQVIGSAGRERSGLVMWRTEEDEFLDCGQGIKSRMGRVVLAVGGRCPPGFDRVIAQLEQVVGSVPGVIGEGSAVPGVAGAG